MTRDSLKNTVFGSGPQIQKLPEGNELEKKNNPFRWCNFSVVSSAGLHTKPTIEKTDFPLSKKSQGRADLRKSIV